VTLSEKGRAPKNQIFYGDYYSNRMSIHHLLVEAPLSFFKTVTKEATKYHYMDEGIL